METEEIKKGASNGETMVALAELILEHRDDFKASDRLSVEMEKGYVTKIIKEIMKSLKSEESPEIFAVLLMMHTEVIISGFTKTLPRELIAPASLMFALQILKHERK